MTHRTVQDSQYAARASLRAALYRTVEDLGEKDPWVIEPVFRGASTTERRPRPELGLRAAVLLHHAAAYTWMEQVRRCRGAGTSWADIAVLLELENAEAAFEAAAPHQLTAGYDPTVSWTCRTCDRYVTDKGPYNGHPADCETGHAEDCVRHLHEIADYRRELGE